MRFFITFVLPVVDRDDIMSVADHRNYGGGKRACETNGFARFMGSEDVDRVEDNLVF
jgi:hypothetical protein